MDRFTLGVVGGVLALVAAGLIAAAVVAARSQPPDVSTPRGVVLTYAVAEQRGDADAAWNLLASTTQARGDRERFLARAGNGADDTAYLTTEDERTDADGASVVLVRTYGRSSGLFGNSSYSQRQT